ncbi:MAG: nucleotide sugar dehydrogenase [Candidatus Aenigmarchaeota archaeon]|nr:nucleotide sugar dehydrogenase [Candidatus Aenigmarchaeota archaeon]
MGIKDKLLSGEKRIAVWGTGFIGFTTMANFAHNGVRCVGLDVDKEKVRAINRGEIPIDNLEYWLGFEIGGLVKSGLMKSTTDWHEAMKPDIAVHFVSIPTEKEGKPYDDILIDVTKKLTGLKKIKNYEPPLIIVESTLTPGRSDKIILPLLKDAGIEVGRDIMFGVAPRRDWFVSPEKSLKKLPRVFGGTTGKTTEMMRCVLSIVCENLVPSPDHKHAEMVKSIENAYRHMDITLANQLSLAYPDVDMKEVLRLVGTKWNVGTFHPSFGTGGYCIPLSSQYVLLGASRPEHLTVLKETIESDEKQPNIVADNLVKRGAKRVGILGLAYKGDIKVSILSPTIKLAKRLAELGVEVKVNDPYYSKEEIKTIAGADSFDFPAGLQEFDAVLIVADHQHYRFTPHNVILSALRSCKLVLDNTEIWRDIDFKGRGIEYHIAGDAGWLKA